MKTLRPPQLRPLLATPLLLAIMLNGCAHRPPPPSGPPVFKEWLPALQERSAHWQRYQARVRLKAQSPEKQFSLEALIVANLPDQFRLEAFRMGQTVGVLILNHGQASLFVPSEKVLLHAARSEDLTNYLLGIALPAASFGYSLSASVPPDQLAGFQVVPREQHWFGFARSAADDSSSEWQFCAEPQAATSVRFRGGSWDCTARYEPPVALVAAAIPEKITFSSAQWQIETTVQELQSLEAVQESAFGDDFGSEVRRVKVAPLPVAQ